MASDPIRDRVRELVAKDLRNVKGEINPREFGWGLYDNWPAAAQIELISEHVPLVRSMASALAIELTNLKPPPPNGQKDFWGEEQFVSTPIKGNKIKYGESQWLHQLIEREEEIADTLRSSRKFSHGEERRSLLKDAGMEADANMTVRQAIAILEKKSAKKRPPGKEPPPEHPDQPPA